MFGVNRGIPHNIPHTYKKNCSLHDFLAISSASAIIKRMYVCRSSFFENIFRNCKYKMNLSEQKNRKESTIMKKTLFALTICIMACMSVHGQESIVIQRPGILTDLASATGTIISLPFAVVEGIVVGTAEAAGSLIHSSAEIIVVPSATPVSAPVIVTSPQPVRPSTTIITTHGDGTITTITRQASAYELGPVVLTPVDPTHRVGPSPYVNPYVYRHR